MAIVRLRSSRSKAIVIILIIVIAVVFLWHPLQVAWLLFREPFPLPANARALATHVHSRTPRKMAEASYSKAKLAQLRFYLDYGVHPEGDSRQVDAICALVAMKEPKSLERMKNIVRWKSRSKVSWMLVWGAFCIEGQASSPFLLECFDRGVAGSAESCFRRLSFLDSDGAEFSLKRDSGNPGARKEFWTAWWKEQQGTSWNERLSQKMCEVEPTLDAAEAKSLCLKVLVEFLEKHPLPMRHSYSYPEEGLSTETLVSMRVSELLCEKTGLYESPWCFPLGFPDVTWQEVSYDLNKPSNWRVRLMAEGYDLNRCE